MTDTDVDLTGTIDLHLSAGTRDALVVKMKACFANMLRVAYGETPADVVTPPITQGAH